MSDTKERILDVAIEVLGKSPDAGMGDIALAAGVVRRTVYGYFPSRSDLVLAIMQRAVADMATVLAEEAAVDKAADEAWADLIARLWPMASRYRVLVVLRRGEFGEGIHALLGPLEETLAALVERGQDSGVFGRHLPADVLSQVAWSTVFAIADNDLSPVRLGVAAVATTSLLMLGVPHARAKVLVERGS